MKSLPLLIVLLLLTACTIQPQVSETEQPAEQKTTQEKTETREAEPELFIKEATRRYGIETKYSGLRDEDGLLCANFYAQDITPFKNVAPEDRNPTQWFAFAYLSPGQILKIDSFQTSTDEEEYSWHNKYCLIKQNITNEYLGKEARIVYTTVPPIEMYGESFLAIYGKDNRKTFIFKDTVK